jgi:hypothetical protein
MVLSIAGSTGVASLCAPSTSQASSAPETIEPGEIAASSGFRASRLSQKKDVVALVRWGEQVENEVRGCNGTLGETDRVEADAIGRYVLYGDLSETSAVDSVFPRLAELDSADTVQTPESRMHCVLHACREWLEAARGPGLNLLHVAGRTGTIVALASVAREVVSHYIKEALREGDSTEAAQAWGVAAFVLVDLLALLLGAIRNELKGNGSVPARIGRLCMAGITIGSFIAAHLTGASKSLLAAMAGGSMYTVVRGACNACITLPNNAREPNAANTGATALVYSLMQFALNEVSGAIPVSDRVGAGAIGAMLNALGMVADDYIGLLFRSSDVLSPHAGRDSVFLDPQSALEVRASAQWPSATEWESAASGIGALRGAAVHSFTLFIGAVAALLSSAEVDEGDERHILSACVAFMAFIIYFPLIFGSAKPSGNSFTLPAIEFP